MSLNGASGTLLRARLAQHGSLYRTNVLLSLVMTVQHFRRAPTGAYDTGILRHRLARLSPTGPHGQCYLILPGLVAPLGLFHTILVLLPDFTCEQTLCFNDVTRTSKLQV